MICFSWLHENCNFTVCGFLDQFSFSLNAQENRITLFYFTLQFVRGDCLSEAMVSDR